VKLNFKTNLATYGAPGTTCTAKHGFTFNHQHFKIHPNHWIPCFCSIKSSYETSWILRLIFYSLQLLTNSVYQRLDRAESIWIAVVASCVQDCTSDLLGSRLRWSKMVHASGKLSGFSLTATPWHDMDGSRQYFRAFSNCPRGHVSNIALYSRWNGRMARFGYLGLVYSQL
jgi:hypothetical protein